MSVKDEIRRPRLLVLNGPNLSRLGSRKPEIYGRQTLNEIIQDVGRDLQTINWLMVAEQSDNEADLIRFLFENSSVNAAIINPGALMIAGWSLRDALEEVEYPWIEVHISNIWAREEFRHSSILSPIASGVVAGLGTIGYKVAARAAVDLAIGLSAQ